MEMFHNKKNSAFCEQLNMGNSQLSCSPRSSVSYRKLPVSSHSKAGGHFCSPPQAWLLERLSRPFLLSGQDGHGGWGEGLQHESMSS